MSIADYRKSIRATRGTGQATEHSYRSALQQLLTDLGGNDVEAINEPTQADYGAPDFIVELRQVPIGHVECKDIGTNLDTEEDSEQLERYRKALPNLILTDYLQFRWYVDGELRTEARLGRFDNAGRFITDTGGDEAVRELLANFFDAQIPVVGGSADLARRMASKTRLLRSAIEQVLAEDSDNAPALAGLLASYREVLINDLSVEDFADLQAQTAAYGLFAARCLHQEPAETFSRQSAVFAETTPFLRDVFVQIAGPNADSRIAWVIDDLALLLKRADMAAVLEGFGTATRQEDPIVHFYEDFLAAYDPRLRELRGVYYTPEPVVSYIVRSVDWVLRDRFGLADGLADTDTVEIVADDGPPRTPPGVGARPGSRHRHIPARGRVPYSRRPDDTGACWRMGLVRARALAAPLVRLRTADGGLHHLPPQARHGDKRRFPAVRAGRWRAIGSLSDELPHRGPRGRKRPDVRRRDRPGGS